MLLGVGTDIIEIDRIDAVLKRHPVSFIRRIFSPFEIDFCQKKAQPARHFAARWAAKEAIAKCLGEGIGTAFGWSDVWIENNASGKPIACFSKRWIDRLGSSRIELSMSHCNQYAVAMAVWHE